jgi:hypothetical protein
MWSNSVEQIPHSGAFKACPGSWWVAHRVLRLEACVLPERRLSARTPIFNLSRNLGREWKGDPEQRLDAFVGKSPVHNNNLRCCCCPGFQMILSPLLPQRPLFIYVARGRRIHALAIDTCPRALTPCFPHCIRNSAEVLLPNPAFRHFQT